MANLSLILILALSTVVWSSSYAAQTDFASGQINYEGRFTDSNGDPLVGSADITLEVLTEDEACVLYSEQHTSWPLLDGYFSLRLGSGTRTGGDPGLTMVDVFKNSHTHAGSVCSGVTIGLSEARYLRVKVKFSGVEEVLSPNQLIAAVPVALRADVASNSEKLQNFEASDFVQVDGTNVTQSNVTQLTNGSDAGSLHHHDSKYAKINSSSSMTFGAGETLGLGRVDNAQQATLTSGLGTADAGKTWYNSDTGLIMYWDGNSAEAVGASTSAITSLNGHTGAAQTFTTPGTTGTAPNWDFSTTNQHKLNIPMASAAGVTAGLLSNTDYASFNSRLSSTDSPNASGDISGNYSTGLNINNDAVTGSMILDGQVDSVDIANDAITTAKIANSNVTTAKIADANITAAKIADSNVTTAKIADGAVSLTKLGSTGSTALQAIRRNAGNTAWEYYTPSDTDTTYTADGSGIEMSATVFSLELDGTTLSKSSTGLKVNAIGSAEITDGSIANADINTSAGIARSKMASGTANRVLVNNGSGVMSESASIDSTELGFLDGVTSNIQTQLDSKQSAIGYTPVNKAGDSMTGDLTLNSQNDLRLADSDSSNYAAIQSPATITANYTLTLPVDDGNSGQVLATDGSGILSWASVGTGSVTSVTAGTGLSGGTITTSGTIGIAAGGVSATELATNAVTTAKITDGNVTSAKILDGAVTSSKITDGSVTDVKITSVGVDKVSSGSGKYLTYAPNGTVCTNGQVLKWNTSSTRWECGDDTSAGVLSAGTNNKVPKFSTGTTLANSDITNTASLVSIATGVDLQVSTSAFFVDASANSVGIGTTTPTVALDVVGDVHATGDIQVSAGRDICISGGNCLSSMTASSGTVTNVATGTGLTGGPITTTGTISLANTAVTPSSYGSASSVATFTVDAQGRLTAAGSTAIGGLNTSVLTAGTLAAGRMPAFTGDITNTAGTLATTISNNAVTSAKILDGTITSADLDATIGPFLIDSAGTAGQVWTSDGSGAGTWTTPTNANTASAIVKRDASGNFSAGTITANLTGNVTGNLSGNATTATTATNVSGVVGLANGGTGQSSAAAAFNALVPSQTGNSGRYLTTNGTTTSWATVSASGDNLGNHTATTGLIMSGFGISGLASGAPAAPALSFSGDSNTGLFAPGADQLSLATAGVEALKIDASGNVGLGTSSPGAKLEVVGQIKITGGTPALGQVLTSDGNGLATWEPPGSGSDNLGNHEAAQNIDLNTFQLVGNNGTSGISISSGGNVGVGTTSPTSPLHVKKDQTANTQMIVDNSSATNGARASIMLQNDSGVSGISMFSSGSTGGFNNDLFIINQASGGDIQFSNGVSSSVIIKNNGAVQFNGNVTQSVNSTVVTGTSVDFNNGNIQTASSTGTLTLSNMASGGSYTLVATDTGTSQINFTTSGLSQKWLPANGNRVSGAQTIYNFFVVGTTVYISWSSGWQ